MPTLRDNSNGGVQPHKNTHVSGGSDAFQTTDFLEAIVKRLRESGGPTTLSLGAIADGEYLKRSGTGVVGAGASPAATSGGLYARWYGSGTAPGDGDLIYSEVTGEIDWTNRTIGGLTTNYSAAIVGWIKPQYSENYTIYVLSDDGTMCFVNGRVIASRSAYKGQAPTTYSATTGTLVAGNLYPILLLHQQFTGGERLRLQWSSASQSQQNIPAARMFYTDPAVDNAADQAMNMVNFIMRAPILSASADRDLLFPLVDGQSSDGSYINAGLVFYMSYTDASNYERVVVGRPYGGNDAQIMVQKAGTGSNRDLLLGGNDGVNITFYQNGSNRWTFNTSGNQIPAADGTQDIGSASFRLDDVYSMKVTASTYARIGTATDASAAGDESVGLTGAARRFYDQSVPIEYYYDSSGSISIQLSEVAGTATVFNEQGADIDLRVEGDTDANLLSLDASTDSVGVGIAVPAFKQHVNGTQYVEANINPRRIFSVHKTPGTAATLTAIGGTPTHTLSGTASNLSDSTGHYVSLTNTKVVGNVLAGVDIATTEVVKTEISPIMTAVIKTPATLPAASVGQRIWIGLSNASLLATDSPTGNHVAAFRYAPDADGTAFWRCVTNDAGANTGTTTTTSVAIATSTRYVLVIDATNSASIKFFINGVLVATHSTDLPTTTQALGCECFFGVSGSGTGVLNISRLEYQTK